MNDSWIHQGNQSLFAGLRFHVSVKQCQLFIPSTSTWWIHQIKHTCSKCAFSRVLLRLRFLRWQKTLLDSIGWYNSLFKITTGIAVTLSSEKMNSRRLRVAAMKQCGTVKKDRSVFLEELPQGICEIVCLYEKSFEDSHQHKVQCSKRFLKMDYMEWL